MIYLVTANLQLFSNDTYKIITVEESLKLLETISLVGFDTETSGLSAWNDKLLLVQLGNKDFQVVIDCRTIDILLYKDYLESNRLFIGWNLKFDIGFMYEKGIIIKNIYDGMIAEKLLWLGYPSGFRSMSLKAAGENYLGIELDKSVRGKIIWSPVLTDDIIVYGAEDVAHLEDIYNAQQKLIVEKDLTKALEIENKFIIPLAYTEWCGIKLDADKWRIKMKKDKEREEAALELLNQWIIKVNEEGYFYKDPNNPFDLGVLVQKGALSKYITINTQGDLFAENPFDLTPKVIINWNSAKQVIPLFKMFGISVEVEDREKGGTKDSVDAKSLKPQKSKCSLIPLYIEYKEAVKITSTYGENFLDQIDEKRGRIKSKFNSLGTDTGRLSSGGKDGNYEYINFQNLPADKETRECFICEEGNRFISIDFSGEESFLMASIANDKAMLNELINGDKDLHTLTAKIVFSDQIPFDTPTEVVKTKYKELRKVSKGYEFKEIIN